MYWANLLHIYQPYFQTKKIIHKVVTESYDKILSILEARPNAKITLNICASLTEKLVEYGYIHILERIKKLAENGQIEFVGSAKYHPILPFLSKSEIIRQIKLNENINQKYFKSVWRPRPKGFFLPELAYDKKTARIIQSLGYEWIVLDEIAYDNTFNHVSFNRRYEIKDLFRNQGKKKNLKVTFRNRGVSLIFFGTWLDSVDKFLQSVKHDGRSDTFLVTAFDGETLGHHRAHLIDIWAKILDQKEIKTITYSQYLHLLKDTPIKQIDPLACSWASEIKDLKQDIPYALWSHPDNDLHKLQWQLTHFIIKLIKKYDNSPQYKRARKLLDKAFASDQYWWASAKPWWNPNIIKINVEKFLKIASLLKSNLSDPELRKVEKIHQNILEEIGQREISGKYIVIETISDWK
ncbi:polysaccharide deacetylase family protein [Patescibacteria group bacterium AH-259-L05]|nr:polysaccharide deacetylase family protein [Patescibacteria group bacterium AH-259-L05]